MWCDADIRSDSRGRPFSMPNLPRAASGGRLLRTLGWAWEHFARHACVHCIRFPRLPSSICRISSTSPSRILSNELGKVRHPPEDRNLLAKGRHPEFTRRTPPLELFPGVSLEWYSAISP